MRTFRKIQIVTLLGILIVCTGRIALSSYMPGAHTGHFWFRTFWGCFLISLVGLVKGQFVEGVIFGRAKQQWDGILPSLETVTFFYALASISLMTVCAWLPENPVLSSIHIPAQIIMTTVFCTLVLTLYIAYIGAMHGTRQSPEGMKILDDLYPLLEAEENRFLQLCGRNKMDEARRLHDAIKTLREKMCYSLPRRGSTTYSASYATLSATLQGLVETIKTIDPNEPSMTATMNNATDRTLALSRQIGVISKEGRTS